ncbi:3'5' cyclic nucleotide phosphodiesterase, partial [Reticulomyxa filosa]
EEEEEEGEEEEEEDDDNDNEEEEEEKEQNGIESTDKDKEQAEKKEKKTETKETEESEDPSESFNKRQLLLQKRKYDVGRRYTTTNLQNVYVFPFISNKYNLDKDGFEVARWLCSNYSQFRRYDDPSGLDSPLVVMEHELNGANDTVKDKGNDDNDKKDKDKDKENNDEEDDDDNDEYEKRIVGLKREKVEKLLLNDKIKQVLSTFGEWNWSIFELEQLCPNQSIVILSHFIFTKLGLFEKFGIARNAFQNFFTLIQHEYGSNPYHNALHGADVMKSMYYWTQSDEFRSYVSEMDVLVALVASCVHDFKHPGTTQEFHIKTSSDLALLYNGKSVLENMHCSQVLRILFKSKQHSFNIFSGIDKKEWNSIRQLCADMILATDMTYHNDLMKTIRDMINRRQDVVHGISEHNRVLERTHCLTIGLHLCDLANPTYPWKDCQQWTRLLMEEWYRQGDQEKLLGIPLSPMMDRLHPNVPRGQIGFIDYVVAPLFDCWGVLFPETLVCLKNLRSNRSHWEKLLSQQQNGDTQRSAVDDSDVRDPKLDRRSTIHSRNSSDGSETGEFFLNLLEEVFFDEEEH